MHYAKQQELEEKEEHVVVHEHEQKVAGQAVLAGIGSQVLAMLALVAEPRHQYLVDLVHVFGHET